MLSRYCLAVSSYESGRLEQNKKVAKSSERVLWPFDVISEILGSVAIDPSNRWIGFSPCWPIGGRSVPLLPFQIWSPRRLVPLLRLLFLCAIRNSFLNHLTFPAWISAACLILLILLLSICFFVIFNLSAMSTGSRSWMSYRHVSCWIIWMYRSSSNVLGSVKKVLESKNSSPSKLSTMWGMRRFLEHVLIAGGVITISAIRIKSNPGGWSVYH